MKTPKIPSKWLSVIKREVSRRVSLAVLALDDPRDRQISGEGTSRDRFRYDRDKVLDDALQAWRENPIARRIVELTTEYVCGGRVDLVSSDGAVSKFLKEFWSHPLNRMVTRVFELCDDLTRTGDLFIIISTDVQGMSYIRAIPAIYIGEIDTAENDVEQETFFVDKRTMAEVTPLGWAGYNWLTDAREESGAFKPVMLHFAVNRPIGGKFGEADLAPLLKWLKRHSAWLEDRARLNRFRTAFMWVFKKAFEDSDARAAKQKEFNENPPGYGSILVLDGDESMEAQSPKLESNDAGLDGLALKKMILSGAGTPLHWLAEPESATRTTAELSGGPAFRHYERRQVFFFDFLKTIARVVLRRRAMVDSELKADAELGVSGTDIFTRDNASLAAAATAIVTAFSDLRDRLIIDDQELCRLAYKFAGEIVDVNGMVERGRKAGVPTALPTGPRPSTPAGVSETLAAALVGASRYGGNGHEQTDSSGS